MGNITLVSAQFTANHQNRSKFYFKIPKISPDIHYTLQKQFVLY